MRKTSKDLHAEEYFMVLIFEAVNYVNRALVDHDLVGVAKNNMHTTVTNIPWDIIGAMTKRLYAFKVDY